MARRDGAAVYIDDSELAVLEADLRSAPGRVQRGMPKALMRGAQVIDRAMTIDASGHLGNWYGEPGTSYVTPTPPVSHELIAWDTAEIGIEYRGVGKLFHILAYGSVNNDPAYDPEEGPRRALPEVVDHMADHAENSILPGIVGPSARLGR
jgi:hypothetical protein